MVGVKRGSGDRVVWEGTEVYVCVYVCYHRQDRTDSDDNRHFTINGLGHAKRGGWGREAGNERATGRGDAGAIQFNLHPARLPNTGRRRQRSGPG